MCGEGVRARGHGCGGGQKHLPLLLHQLLLATQRLDLLVVGHLRRLAQRRLRRHLRRQRRHGRRRRGQRDRRLLLLVDTRPRRAAHADVGRRARDALLLVARPREVEHVGQDEQRVGDRLVLRERRCVCAAARGGGVWGGAEARGRRARVCCVGHLRRYLGRHCGLIYACLCEFRSSSMARRARDACVVWYGGEGGVEDGGD